MSLIQTLAQLFPEHAGAMAQQGVAGAPGIGDLMPGLSPQAPPAPPADPSQLGLAQAIQQQVPAPVDPAAAHAARVAKGSQRLALLGATLKDIGQGLGGKEGTALDNYQAQNTAQQQRTQRMADAKALFPDDPRMQIMYASGDAKTQEAIATSLSKSLEPYTQGEGTLHHDSSGDHYLGKTGVENGFAYSTNQDGSTNWGSERPQSYGETETARKNAADEVQHVLDQAQLLRLGLGHLGVEQQNATTGAYRAHKAPAGGHPGTPGLPSGFVLDTH